VDSQSLTVPDAPWPTTNRRFANYELESILGRGGMGVVYKATQVNPRRLVALKMLVVEAEAGSPNALRRFSIEAEAAAKLDHPNIVPIYEVGEHEGQPFLSMKLIGGETLRRKFATGELSFSMKGRISRKSESRERIGRIVQVLTQISRAVHHAHDHGVLHRDLKPGNIMIDSNGTPHLTDFGLAKILKGSGETDVNPVPSATSPGTALGTVSYMSPEQGQGEQLSPASDVYSLGAILYEALTGSPPFTGATFIEVVRATAEQTPVAPAARNPQVDRDLNTICLKCLEKTPAARYHSAAELAEDLERWRRREPIRARRAGPLLRSARWVARNRLAAGLIGSLCAGLVTVLFLLDQSLARQHQLDVYREHNIKDVNEDIQKMFDSPLIPFTLVSSTRLADLADLPPTPPEHSDRTLNFGLTINAEPFSLAFQHAPFLNTLEKRIGGLRRNALLLDLLLYKNETRAVTDLVEGKVDLLRMDPFLFVLNHQKAPGLTPLAGEKNEKEVVIFASGRSGVTNLQQIIGKRVIFGQETSIVTFWAKVHLARQGISAADLASYQYASGAKDADPKKASDRDPNMQANKQAIYAVLWGNMDVGVATRRHFEMNRHRPGGLVELLKFSVMPEIYVASPRIAAASELTRTLRAGFLSFRNVKDKKLLASLTDNPTVEAFDEVDIQKLDQIRAAMTNEFAEFEGKSRSTLQQ
jgi:serine/threonine protein kinase